jgi:DNA polymerase-3 subunit chi
MSAASEVLFYHLERQPLDKVLPALVEKSVERGWRAVVQVGNEERVAAIDSLLWTYANESFLPHGTKADGDPMRQPVFITTERGNPNGASIRFLVDGAAPGDWTGYQRIVLMFNGRDEEAVAAARGHWKAAKAAGCQCTYWQQSVEGRWEKKA